MDGEGRFREYCEEKFEIACHAMTRNWKGRERKEGIHTYTRMQKKDIEAGWGRSCFAAGRGGKEEKREKRNFVLFSSPSL